MPTYRYWLRDAGISSSKLTTSTALASLMSGRGYSVRMLHPLSGEYTTQGGITPGMLDHDPYPSIKDGVPYLEMDGWVYGLVGDTQINSKQRPVTFSGPAHASLNGMAVEFRLVGDGGEAVTGWVPAGTISSGGWSVTRTVPATNHWCWREVRLATNPSVVTRSTGRCAVGYKHLLVGPSSLARGTQCPNPSVFGTAFTMPPRPDMGKVAYCTFWEGKSTLAGGNDNSPPRYGITGSGTPPVSTTNPNSYQNCGQMLLAQQLAVLVPGIHAIVNASEAGRGVWAGSRNLLRMQAEIDQLKSMIALSGNDFTVLLFNEAVNAGSTTETLASVLRGGAPGQLMYFDQIVQPGYRLVNATARGQQAATVNVATDQFIQSAIQFHAEGGVTGVLALTRMDLRDTPESLVGNITAHPRQDVVNGAVLQASITGMDIAAAFGAGPGIPYFGQARFGNAARTEIIVPVVAANGGAISAIRPDNISGFLVMDTAAGTTSSYIRVTLSGNQLKIVHPEGAAFAATSRVRLTPSLYHSAGGYFQNWPGNGQPGATVMNNAGDQTVFEGIVWEAYPQGLFSYGLPVMGQVNDDGLYLPVYDKAVLAYTP